MEGWLNVVKPLAQLSDSVKVAFGDDTHVWYTQRGTPRSPVIGRRSPTQNSKIGRSTWAGGDHVFLFHYSYHGMYQLFFFTTQMDRGKYSVIPLDLPSQNAFRRNRCRFSR